LDKSDAEFITPWVGMAVYLNVSTLGEGLVLEAGRQRG